MGRTRPARYGPRARGATIGHLARESSMVELLPERGADPTAAGAPWSAPPAWAQKKGHNQIADL
jgi:hypothetical protein